MDMKKILQAFDGASAKPVEGSNDMKKFLSVVTEGATPHKVSLPVQMAMQHYAEPVKKAKPKQSLLTKYFTEAEEKYEHELAEERAAKDQRIKQYAQKIAQRVLENSQPVSEISSDLKKRYVKAAIQDKIDRASSDSFKSGAAGDKYNKADITDKDERRDKGIERALTSLKEDHTDTVTVDVPLLIRLLEYAREDISTDIDLHKVAEKLILLAQSGKTLTMDHYDSITSE